MIKIADTARVSPLADIEDSIFGTSIVIGENASIDAFVKIKPAGGRGNLSIGARTAINSGCVLYTGNGITIGDDCAIAANCTLAPVNHNFARRDIPINQQGFQPSKGGVVIEDDVWIGANCVILDGAIIRRGAVVGAGSLVRSEVAPHSVVAGNPLRQISVRGL
jgi:virginiamycin A acetyltransferase